MRCVCSLGLIYLNIYVERSLQTVLQKLLLIFQTDHIAVVHFVERSGAKPSVEEDYYKIRDGKMVYDEQWLHKPESGFLPALNAGKLCKVEDPDYQSSEYDRDTAVERARRRVLMPDMVSSMPNNMEIRFPSNREFAKAIGLIDFADEDAQVATHYHRLAKQPIRGPDIDCVLM